jgi:hypothetical protein
MPCFKLTPAPHATPPTHATQTQVQSLPTNTPFASFFSLGKQRRLHPNVPTNTPFASFFSLGKQRRLHPNSTASTAHPDLALHLESSFVVCPRLGA